jgi:hypothetical protein
MQTHRFRLYKFIIKQYCLCIIYIQNHIIKQYCLCTIYVQNHIVKNIIHFDFLLTEESEPH